MVCGNNIKHKMEINIFKCQKHFVVVWAISYLCDISALCRKSWTQHLSSYSALWCFLGFVGRSTTKWSVQCYGSYLSPKGLSQIAIISIM